MLNSILNFVVLSDLSSSYLVFILALAVFFGKNKKGEIMKVLSLNQKYLGLVGLVKERAEERSDKRAYGSKRSRILLLF